MAKSKETLSLTLDRGDLWEDARSELFTDYGLDYQAWSAAGKRGAEPHKPTHDDITARYQELVEAAQEKWQSDLAKYGAYSATYELADRVLTNQDISVVMVNDPNNKVVAWSDGSSVTFNFGAITGEVGDDDFMLSLHGLNHHEVAHLLWTPRAGSSMVKWIAENKLFKSFNILEDNRIESLMVAKYPSTKSFLLASAIKQIVNHPDNEDSFAGLFPLLCGRHYLPVELRQDLARDFAAVLGVDTTRTIQTIVDEYRTLVLPAQESRARELIEQYAQLLHLYDEPEQTQWQLDSDGNIARDENGDPIPMPSNPKRSKGDSGGNFGGHTSCAGREPMKSGRPEAGKQQEKWAQKVENNNIDLSEDALTQQEIDDYLAGNKPKKDIKRYAQDILDEVSKSDTTKREIDQVRSAIRQSAKGLHTLPKTNGTELPVSADMRLLARQFADELIRAEIDADPAWEKEQPSGRLNIQRAMRADVNSLNSLFDKWTFGDTTTEIDAAILLDNSGSMGYHMSDVNECAWIIKRGIEAINGRASVLTFSTFCKRLYDFEDKAMPTTFRAVKSQASTDPHSALVEASVSMEASQAPNKIVFMLTDGYWDNADACDAQIAKLQESGVMVVVIFLGDTSIRTWNEDNTQVIRTPLTPQHPQFKQYSHGADLFVDIPNPRGLVKVARSVVLETLSKAGAH